MKPGKRFACALLALLPLLVAGKTPRALAMLEYVSLEGEAQTAWTCCFDRVIYAAVAQDDRSPAGIPLYQ